MNLDDIKSRVSIVDLAQHLGIQCDSHHKALCPFHNEKTPSFMLFPDTNTFFCFGCSRSGSIFDLVMEKKDCSFADSVRYLCRYAGINEPYDSDVVIQKSQKSNALMKAYEIFQDAGKRNQKKLKNWAEGRLIPIRYLEAAGAAYISGGEITKRGNEFDIADWAGFCNAGVITKTIFAQENNQQLYLNLGYKPQDVFYYEGVVFPIYDAKHNLTGFVCRSAEASEKIPKYKYNEYFNKNSNLFCIDVVARNLDAGLKQKKAFEVFDIFLVEGIMDAVRMNALGFNAIAIMGTSLASDTRSKDQSASRKQVQLLEELISRAPKTMIKIHVFMDNDSPGQNGARRIFNTLYDLCNHHANLIFDFVGITEEEGKDPDDIFKQIDGKNTLDFIDKSLFSPADFLVAHELDISLKALQTTWQTASIFHKDLTMSRIVGDFPNTPIDFNKLLKFGYQNKTLISSTDAAKELKWQLDNRYSIPVQRNISQEISSISWEKIVEKARVSCKDSDFPIDQNAWDRIRDGLPVLQYFLNNQLKQAKLIEPCTPAFHPRNIGENPRMLMLPSPEDLVLETAFLTDLLQLGISYPGQLPIVFDNGNGTVTYQQKTEKNSNFRTSTVSFAYQFNACEQSTSGIYESSGIFKDFHKCWNDYNEYLLQHVNQIEKNFDTIYCVRLDIHRYYDSITYADVSRLLNRLFSNIAQFYEQFPALKIISAGNQDTASERFVRWICTKSFKYPYYSEKDGSVIHSTNSQRGIPQGSNLSAWLANTLLFDLDYAVNQKCEEINQKYNAKNPQEKKFKASCFARYVDDMIIVAPTRKDVLTIQMTLQQELDKLKLSLSNKIENEEIHSFSEMREMLRRNRGVLTPYCEELADFTSFNESTFALGIMLNNIDRKNLLNYIYSMQSLENIFTEEQEECFNRLRDIIVSTVEVRYRDYRKIISLIIYTILYHNPSISSECFISIIARFWKMINHPLECENTALLNGSAADINLIWPLFSTLEAIQKILYSRQEQYSLLSFNARNALGNARIALAKMIMNEQLVHKLIECTNNGTNATDSFSDILYRWEIALSAFEGKISEHSMQYFKDEYEKAQGYWKYRYGLYLREKNNQIAPSSYDKDFPYRSTVYFFHYVIDTLKYNGDIALNDSPENFRSYNVFKALCNSEDNNTELNVTFSAGEQLDALSVFARCVPSEAHFEQLKKRPMLVAALCDIEKYSNAKLITSPLQYPIKHLLVFKESGEQLDSIFIIMESPDAIPNTFESLPFEKLGQSKPCCLPVFTANVSNHRLGTPLAPMTSCAEKIKTLQEIWNAFNTHENFDKEVWERLVFSYQNIVKIQTGYSLIAFYGDDAFPYALLRNGELRTFDQSQCGLFKLGCAALEYVGLTVPACKEKVTHLLDKDIDFSQQDWCDEFMILQARRLFSGIFGKSKYRDPQARIKYFFDFCNQVQTGELSNADKIVRYWAYQWDFQHWLGSEKLKESGTRYETKGSLSQILEFMLADFFKYEQAFYKCLKSIVSTQSFHSSRRISLKRRNVQALYALSEILECILENSQDREKEQLPLPALFKGISAITYARDLCYDWKELLPETFWNKAHVWTKELASLSEFFQINEAIWFSNDELEESNDERIKRLLEVFKNGDRNTETQIKITPIGITLLLYLMWICEFRTIQDSIEIIQFHAEQESVKEILFSAMLVTFSESATWSQEQCQKLSEKYDAFIRILEKIETDSGIEVTEGKGRNICNTNREFYSISRESEYVYSPQQVSITQILPPLDVESETNNQKITYYWSETWHQKRLLGVAVINQSLRYYLDLLTSSNTQPMEEVKEINISHPQAIPEAENVEAGVSSNSIENTSASSIITLIQKNVERHLDDLFEAQSQLWRTERKMRNSDKVRVALCQFNIGKTSYCLKRSADLLYSTNEYMFDTNEKYEKSQEHIKKILSKAIQICERFKVDALLLPEYSVTPKLVDFIIQKLAGCCSDLIVWAGTFRCPPQGIDFSELDESKWRNVLPSEDKALLCVVSKDGVLKYRGKKYPSIACQEDFRPWTEDIIPLFENKEFTVAADFTKYISEYICSEVFLMTSPINAFPLIQAHLDLVTKYGVKRVAKYENYFRDVLMGDYLTLAKYSGFCSDPQELAESQKSDNILGYKDRIRKTIFMIPACSTRAKDFHILGQNNSFAGGITSVFCNAVSSYSHIASGGSCFIGFGSTADHNTMQYLPYNGFMPGVLLHENGQPLSKDEEALVIVDIDPHMGLDFTPRPQMQPPPLNLIAYIPFLKAYPSSHSNSELSKTEIAEYDKIIKKILYLLNNSATMDFCGIRSETKEILTELNELLRIDNNPKHILCRRLEALLRETWRTRSPRIPAALYDFCFYCE